MDPKRFDQLTQFLGLALARRSVIGAAAALLGLASRGNLLPEARTRGRRKHRKRRKRQDTSVAPREDQKRDQRREPVRRRGRGANRKSGQASPAGSMGGAGAGQPSCHIVVEPTDERFDRFLPEIVKGAINPTIIDPQFAATVEAFNECAKKQDVQTGNPDTDRRLFLYVIDSYRKVPKKAQKTNHLPGHALDVWPEIRDGNGNRIKRYEWTTITTCEKERGKSQDPSKPPRIPAGADCSHGWGDLADPDTYPPQITAFFDCVVDLIGDEDAWGGNHSSSGFDPIHIDDRLFDNDAERWAARRDALRASTACSSGQVCNPRTGRCEEMCDPPCADCTTCQDGDCARIPDCCLQTCDSCSECQGEQCVPIDCGSCSHCAGGACLPDYPETCPPCMSVNFDSCLCQGPVCPDGCCAGEECCGDQCRPACPPHLVRDQATCNCVCGVSCGPNKAPNPDNNCACECAVSCELGRSPNPDRDCACECNWSCEGCRHDEDTETCSHVCGCLDGARCDWDADVCRCGLAHWTKCGRLSCCRVSLTKPENSPTCDEVLEECVCPEDKFVCWDQCCDSRLCQDCTDDVICKAVKCNASIDYHEEDDEILGDDPPDGLRGGGEEGLRINYSQVCRDGACICRYRPTGSSERVDYGRSCNYRVASLAPTFWLHHCCPPGFGCMNLQFGGSRKDVCCELGTPGCLDHDDTSRDFPFP